MKVYPFLFLLILPAALFAQKAVVSGPWAGNIELRTAQIWAEVSPQVNSVSVTYSARGSQKENTVKYEGALHKPFNPVKISLAGLKPNTVYDYVLVVDGKKYQPAFKTSFSTKDLWEYRKPAPDFTFLAGSCSYFNDPEFDRPGAPYGGDSSIFLTMAAEKAAFHIWLGDNWYTREVDYASTWGLNARASRDRSFEVIQKFMASMPQYAIWDDHDYGPNDAGHSYIFKKESREIFSSYYLNPTAGVDGEGIYTKFSYSDADFFLTDDRYFRSEPGLADSIHGMRNGDKAFFGHRQMDWLKNALLYSKSTFKFIIAGSQVLNPMNRFECMNEYPAERQELLKFIADNKIRGVVFLTGDRHHSEIIRLGNVASYPLIDITASPYTSGIARARDGEENNPDRVAGTLVEKQNFARISISGPFKNRTVSIKFIGLRGEELSSWQVNQKDLGW